MHVCTDTDYSTKIWDDDPYGNGKIFGSDAPPVGHGILFDVELPNFA